MTHLIRSVIFVSCCALALSACGDNRDTPPQTPVTADYQQMMNEAVSDSLTGIVMAIEGPEIHFIGSAGLADIDSQQPMTTDALMPNGSAGKKATALLAAMLHDQGMLNIDDPISTWLAADLLNQIEHSDQMTLRQLLNHTAGVYDYLDGRTSDAWFEAVLNDPHSLKTDSYALEFALNKPAYFAPGQGFQYSNTGYLLAGLILDKVLGQHHHQALRNQVLIPLGLNHTYYGGVEKALGNTISGYYIDDETGEVLNTKPFYNNIGVADAPLVSTVTDLSALLKAIITDTSIINADTRELILGEDSLVELDTNFFYGLGIVKELHKGKTIYHHGGEEAGYRTENFYIYELDTTITIFINCSGYAVCDNRSSTFVKDVLATLFDS